MSEGTDFVRLGPELWVFGNVDGAFSFSDWPDLPPGLEKMQASFGRESVSKTRGLLDGAIAAAMNDTGSARTLDDLTLPQYVAFLVADYQRMRPARPLFEKAARRFDALGLTGYAEFAREKADEESGHDLLAFRDLKALGLPAEKVIEDLPSARSLALVRYLEEIVETERPVACFGYAYVLERMAELRGQEVLDHVRELVGPNVNATRCWYIHSGVGPEAGHVEELTEFISKMPPKDRVLVIGATHRTAQIKYTHDPVFDDYQDHFILEKLAAHGGLPSKAGETQPSG
jgi:hypothetical protein